MSSSPSTNRTYARTRSGPCLTRACLPPPPPARTVTCEHVLSCLASIGEQPSLLPGDPNSEFSSADVGEARDDSDVDVDGVLELDAKGEVITGFYGKVRVRLCCCVLCWGCL